MGTLKNPTAWIPQPLGYGQVTTVASNNLIDQSSNQLVDQSGNSLITGTLSVVPKAPTTWSNTGL
jgi:hypothetical protein